MNTEILCDAMEYIDDDLLAAVDLLRMRKRKNRGWIRWASLAACVCIAAGGVLIWSRIYGFSSGETESATGAEETMASPTVDEGIPETEAAETGAAPVTEGGAPLWNEEILAEAVPENVQYIRTDGYHEDAQYPAVTLIRSAEELEAYYEAVKDRYDLERKGTVYADTTIGFLDACDRYDEAYFTTHDLLLVLLEEGSGSIRHEVGSLVRTEDAWLLDVIRIEPEVCTDDMAQWHIMIEVEKDLILPEDTIVVE
ncbi:MAG: hypothetical protein IJ480_11385 [Clostridia bacterium]|nr:hypothetical protein [Clostridia bacterium]